MPTLVAGSIDELGKYNSPPAGDMRWSAQGEGAA